MSAVTEEPRPSSRARRAPRPKPGLPVLEGRIGHVFADRTLLSLALTHVSKAGGARAGSYQRLEFLGDRVLGLAIADLLYAAFPHCDEGELSRRLAGLVRRETCAAVATAWDVGPHLVLGPGEVQGGGRRNQTILADVCEAILGAVFLDAGYPAAKGIVNAAFAPGTDTAAPRGRDAKSALQEWAMGRGLPIPIYEVVERSGPASRRRPMDRQSSRRSPSTSTDASCFGRPSRVNPSRSRIIPAASCSASRFAGPPPKPGSMPATRTAMRNSGA